MNDLKLVIMSGRPDPKRSSHPSYGLGYTHFKQTWERICNRPNRPANYSGFGFFRQDYILQIESKGEVVGQTAATHYRTDDLVAQDLPVFECWLGEPFDALKAQGLKSLLSLEFTSIAKEYQPRKIEFNYYKVLINLSILMVKETGSQGIFGHPRRLTKTNKLIEQVGCTPLGYKKDKWGVAVDLYYGRIENLVPFPDVTALRITNELWSTREDLTGASYETKVKGAA